MLKQKFTEGTIELIIRNSGDLNTTGRTYQVSSEYEVNLNTKTLYLNVPEDINSGQSVELDIAQGAGIFNPSHPSQNYNIGVFTDKQPQPSFTSEITISPSYSTQISPPSIEQSTEQKNVPVNWLWAFKTGRKGALEPGEGEITLTYPNTGYSVPDYISTSSILVNGVHPKTVATSGNTITITVPADVTIGNRTFIQVEILESGNVQISDQQASKRKAGKRKPGMNSNTTQGSDLSASTSSEPSDVSGSSEVLPVELTEFTVKKTGNGFARLQWITATEQENYGFYIDRCFTRVRRKCEDGDWHKIDFIDGQGTTSKTSEYEIVDKNLNRSGYYEYRLRQVDYNGASEQFGPVEFKFASPDRTQIMSNYPNPFNPQTTIPFKLSQAGPVRIEVFNYLGRRVQTLVKRESHPAGQFQVQFDGSSLASGTYFVRMQANGKIETMKMVLVK